MTSTPTDALFTDQLQLLERSWAGLADKPEESPEGSLRALWLRAAGSPQSVVRAARAMLPPLDAAGAERLRELVRQRLAGAPLAHLTERQHFMGLELLSGPEALIPRRETELLATAAIAKARAAVAAQGRALVVDVCTGSGNVALAVAAHVPQAQVLAADLSPEAARLAERNAAYVGLAQRVHFAVGDLLAPFDAPEYHARVDVLTCNPPYISSAKVSKMPDEIASHEPRLAFDGGPLGVSVLFRLIAEAPRFVRAGGWLCFEVGLGQGPHLVQRLERGGQYADVEPLADGRGDVRAIAARVRGAAA